MAQAIIPNQLVDGRHMMEAIGEVLEGEENEDDNCALLDEIAKRVAAGGGWSKDERQACKRFTVEPRAAAVVQLARRTTKATAAMAITTTKTTQLRPTQPQRHPNTTQRHLAPPPWNFRPDLDNLANGPELPLFSDNAEVECAIAAHLLTYTHAHLRTRKPSNHTPHPPPTLHPTAPPLPGRGPGTD